MRTPLTTAPAPPAEIDLSGLLPPIAAAIGDVSSAPGKPVRLGAADATKAAILAALASRASGPVLMVVAREGRALDLVEELRAWLGTAASGRLRLFPQHERIPYERALEDRW